jgi:hypothetical protein
LLRRYCPSYAARYADATRFSPSIAQTPVKRRDSSEERRLAILISNR